MLEDIKSYMDNIFSLKGKNILITGCSSGIGQTICYSLALMGASNIIGLYYPEISKEMQEELTRTKTNFFAYKLNLDRIEDVNLEKLFDELEKQFKHIDILINNAGVNLHNIFVDYDINDWNKMMNINLKSIFLISQQFARRSIEKKIKGKIINTASLCSIQGGRNCLGYTVSKHGVWGLTKLMANELGEYDINVNCIMPGYIQTNMTKEFMENKKISQPYLERIPLKRWGTCKDLIGSILFLSSKASDYVNGANIIVDGGYINV